MQQFAYFRMSTDFTPGLRVNNWTFRPETFHLGEIPASGVEREHRHDVYHAVFYIRGGSFRLNGTVREAPSRTVVLLSPGDWHDFHSENPECPGEYHELTFRLQGAVKPPRFPQLCSALNGQPSVTETIRLAEASAAMLARHFSTAAEMIAADRQSAEFALAALLLQMVSLLKNNDPTPRTPRLEAVRKLLESPPDRKITGSMLAAAAHVSYEHLCREFRRQYGLSPKEYRQKMRMETACQMLRFSHRTPKEIAAELGFSDRYAFHKAFRKAFGVTPGKFLAGGGRECQ